MPPHLPPSLMVYAHHHRPLSLPSPVGGFTVCAAANIRKVCLEMNHVREYTARHGSPPCRRLMPVCPPPGVMLIIFYRRAQHGRYGETGRGSRFAQMVEKRPRGTTRSMSRLAGVDKNAGRLVIVCSLWWFSTRITHAAFSFATTDRANIDIARQRPAIHTTTYPSRLFPRRQHALLSWPFRPAFSLLPLAIFIPPPVCCPATASFFFLHPPQSSSHVMSTS